MVVMRWGRRYRESRGTISSLKATHTAHRMAMEIHSTPTEPLVEVRSPRQVASMDARDHTRTKPSVVKPAGHRRTPLLQVVATILLGLIGALFVGIAYAMFVHR
jgi:hypothetical protein